MNTLAGDWRHSTVMCMRKAVCAITKLACFWSDICWFSPLHLRYTPFHDIKGARENSANFSTEWFHSLSESRHVVGDVKRHTFWSCLIRCANMKWIWQVLLKIQSGYESVHRRTDGRTDRRTDNVKPAPFNFVEAGGIINRILKIS